MRMRIIEEQGERGSHEVDVCEPGYVTLVMDWRSKAQHLASFLLILACVSDAARYSIVDTTVGGVLAAKRMQNDDTSEFSESFTT